MSLASHVGLHAAGRFAFLLFLAAVLGYGGFLAYYTLVSFDVVNLHRDALFDDAFYYFEIARNLAAGKFSTFDGGITRTNGYHPVWLLLVTPFYWVLDLESALFGIKALEIMLIAGAVCLVAVAVRLARLPWILVFAVLPALYGHRGMMLGMEAAAGAFFLGATLVAAVLFARDARRWRWLLAGIAFLLPWVRFEYAAIALIVAGGLALLPGAAASASSGLSSGRLGVARLCSTAGLPFAGAVAGILVYFLYNGVVFGGILPVSAATKMAASAQWGESDPVGWATVGRLIRTAGRDAVLVAELCGYALAVWIVARRRGWCIEAKLLLAVLLAVLAFGVENFAVKVQVALLYHTRVDGWSYWYYVPGYLAAALMVPVRCYVAIFLLRRFALGRWASWQRPAVVATCAAGIALSFDPYRFTEPFRFVHESRHSLESMHFWGVAGELVAFERMLPEDAILGSWDSGAVGYFAERPVVNLDGLVNSYDYLRAGPNKWDLWLWGGGVPAFGVTHLVQPVRRGIELGGRGFAYVGSRVLGHATVKVWPHGTSGAPPRSLQSITVPSFRVDGEPSGYRVIRHGRLMQVFLPDCVHRGMASNLPEVLVFSWRAGAENRSERRLWARPRRTELGYCATRFLLPHGAETAADIFVEGTTVARVVADTPPILRSRSGLTVYPVSDDRLLYVREARCRRWRPRGPSYRFLHLHPVARRDLAYGRLAHGFADYRGSLQSMWRQAGDLCLAEVELPAFRIREAITGEVTQGKRVWQARIDGLALRPQATDDFLAAAAPIVRTAEWDVYYREGERKLLYVREGIAGGSERSAGCTAAPVFLHVYPQRVGDLPAWQHQAGFAERGFDFGEVGFVFGSRCFAAVPLPDYELSHLITGVPGGRQHTWHAD